MEDLIEKREELKAKYNRAKSKASRAKIYDKLMKNEDSIAEINKIASKYILVTQDNCKPCSAIKEWLGDHIEYQELNISGYKEMAEYFQERMTPTLIHKDHDIITGYEGTEEIQNFVNGL